LADEILIFATQHWEKRVGDAATVCYPSRTAFKTAKAPAERRLGSRNGQILTGKTL
jgi:hypothetical protein